MTPVEEIQNIDAQIDRLTQEVERLLWERREVINRANLIKGLPLHLHLVIVHHVLHHFVEDL